MVCVSFYVICIVERLVSSVICRFQGLSYSHVPECIEFSFILFIHHNIHFYFELCTKLILNVMYVTYSHHFGPMRLTSWAIMEYSVMWYDKRLIVFIQSFASAVFLAVQTSLIIRATTTPHVRKLTLGSMAPNGIATVSANWCVNM